MPQRRPRRADPPRVPGRGAPETGNCARDARNPLCSDRSVNGGTGNGLRMQDDPQTRKARSATAMPDPRQQRLKLALRENLKRRKSQARGRHDEVAAASEAVDAPPDAAGDSKTGP